MLNNDYFSIDARGLKTMVENGYANEVSIYLNEANKYIRSMSKEVINERNDIINFFEEVYDVFTEDLFDVFSEVLNDDNKYRVYRTFVLGAKFCSKYVTSK